MYLKIVFLLLVSFQVLGLEIDEKLTTRFLKVSKSRKTVLINRGVEDGLVMGDHARFFLTNGVMARGVLVKLSPVRSIWSLYRLVNSDGIVEDKVVSMKITDRVKLTDDRTKSIQSVRGSSVDISGLDDDANFSDSEVDEIFEEDVLDSGSSQNQNEGDDFDDISSIEDESSGSEDFSQNDIRSSRKAGAFTSKNWEVWSLFSLNFISTTTDDKTNPEFTGSESNLDLTAGLEWYLGGGKSFLSQFSLVGFYQISSSTTSSEGVEVSNSSAGFGLGVNWHFYKNQSRYFTFIPFGALGGGVGSTTYTTKTILGTSSESTDDGTMNFFYAGAGAKFFFKNGFGARIQIDYYIRGESLKQPAITSNLDDITISSAGPRIMMGLSYRF